MNQLLFGSKLSRETKYVSVRVRKGVPEEKIEGKSKLMRVSASQWQESLTARLNGEDLEEKFKHLASSVYEIGEVRLEFPGRCEAIKG